MRNIKNVLCLTLLSICIVGCGSKEPKEQLNYTEVEVKEEDKEHTELDSEENKTEEVEEKRPAVEGSAIVGISEQAGANKDSVYGKKRILIIDGKALAVLENSDIYFEYNKDDNTITVDENDWNKVTESDESINDMVEEVEEDTDTELLAKDDTDDNELLSKDDTEDKELLSKEDSTETTEENTDTETEVDETTSEVALASADELPTLMDLLNSHK